MPDINTPETNSPASPRQRFFMVCHHCRTKLYVSLRSPFVHCGDCHTTYRLRARI